jgi:RHS repeat-associated protein
MEQGYDAAGNVINDGMNQYLYDGEGRICAVASSPMPSMMVMTGYIYDADGTRVAKGSITAWSCDPGVNGFQTTSDYVLGPGGEQVTEMGMDANNSLAWQHTNVWSFGSGSGGGKLLGTYDNDGLHFYFNDPLGTRRAQTDYAGVLEQTCQSLPYGDGETCQPTPTEHLFTGKERDAESGNDYFGARYYASSMGRFMSPDEAFADQHPGDPQTWNLYMYARNNPLHNIDPTGRGTASAIAWGIVSGAVSFLYHSTPIPGAVQAVRDLSNLGAARVRAEAQNRAITNTVKALGSSEGRAGLVKAAGDAWNGQSTSEKASTITQATLGVATAVAGGFAAGAGSAADVATTTVTHFTSDAGMAAISESGTLNAGTWVTLPSEIPAGTSSSGVENLLEIGSGKGANSITFDTPSSNLGIPDAGPTTSGGAQQFQLHNSQPIDPTKFKPTN